MSLGTEIHPVFADSTQVPLDELTGIDQLFREVDEQAAGNFRLAGARRWRIDPDRLDTMLDREDRHSYHRLYWAVRYARAMAMGHPQAGAALHRDLKRWLSGARAGWSAMAAYTVAERIASWAEILFWAHDLSTDLISRIKRELWHDARHLHANIEYFLGTHNHLLNDARALYIAAESLPECQDAESWKSTAFDLWQGFFPALVRADGTFTEQSSHYHLLLCRTGLEYFIACRQSGRGVPEGFLRKLRGMFLLANDLLRPDGSLPRFGDNSPDHTVEDLWGVIAAAQSHDLLDAPARHRAITPLTIYYGAPPGPTIPSPPSQAIRLYHSGGFAFLRSPQGAELAVHADPAPEAHAHGDAGRGSFELWWRGQVIIREPGCFLSPFDQRSQWFRSAEAQNVTSLEGLAPAMTEEDQRRMSDWYWRECGEWSSLPDGSIRYTCNAFRRLRPDLKVSRTWSFDADGSLLLEERLDGAQGNVQFSSRVCLGDGHWGELHAGPRCARIERGSVRVVARFPEEVTASIENGAYTPEYGIEFPARVLVLSGRLNLPARWTLRCEMAA